MVADVTTLQTVVLVEAVIIVGCIIAIIGLIGYNTYLKDKR